MTKMVRVLVPVDADRSEALQLALAYAARIAAQLAPRATDVVLLTHTKDQLKRTALQAHLGASAKQLLAGATLSMEGGLTLRHATLRTFRGSSRSSVVVAYYAEDRMLEMLDGTRSVAGVVAVPDGDAVSEWRERWNPVVHGEGTQAAARTLIHDPVVVRALETVTLRSNVSYNTLQPRDRETADEVFRILRARGHALDPAAIKSWAMRRGWRPGAADDLAAVAAKVAALKRRPDLSGIHDPDGRYERWSQ